MPETTSSSLQGAPTQYQQLVNAWKNPSQRGSWFEMYCTGQVSFVPHALPELMVQLPAEDILHILRQRYGASVDHALSLPYANPEHSLLELPPDLRGPVAAEADGTWLKLTNMVGINVRTIGSFWNVVKYTLTLPAAQDSIHLLPIWKPGVVGSIYGISSWDINREFYSDELAALCPWLNTVERQLRAVVNLLHLMGRSVGMDVIPHTDRFSEMALAFPEYFEWLQRQDLEILSHAGNLHEAVQDTIVAFLRAHGAVAPGLATPANREELFAPGVGEAQRLQVLFGPPEDENGREARRKQLIEHLYKAGYETVPATMAPPYRGIVTDPRPEAKTIDDDGRVWRDYRITEPTPLSRVFGPLARFKLNESLDNNAHWELDFDQPRHDVWRYVCEHYAQVQRQFGFDFMRGDMAHVQMRPEGVPDIIDPYYDILGAVKRYVQHENRMPHFGYFAETFLAPRDTMAYGEEMDHLEAAGADTTLGDLQSTVVGSHEFLQRLRTYDDLRVTRLCAPAFTVMTADKDDPRFDLFYRSGNEARLFIALCLTDMPSYMGLGFETRDVHLAPAPNEHYTKLYVFHETSGPKATYGPYIWGQNGDLYSSVTRMKLFLDKIWPQLRGRETRWLIAPDAIGENPLIAWTQRDTPEYVFVVNTAERAIGRFVLPGFGSETRLEYAFSTQGHTNEPDAQIVFNGLQHLVPSLTAGEGRVYRAQRSAG